MTKGNREAEKKRLVEALVGFPLTDSIKVTGTDCVLISRRDAEDLADKLIDANGVIVPPCKVGDVVYFLQKQAFTHETLIYAGTVESISFGDCFELSIYKDANGDSSDGYYYRNSKNIFFTKAEAEQALKERDK